MMVCGGEGGCRERRKLEYGGKEKTRMGEEERDENEGRVCMCVCVVA